MSEELVFADTTKHIKLDSFPINFFQLDEEENQTLIHKECRLIVTNDYIYVIIMEGTGPAFALVEELVEFRYIPKLGFEISGANFNYLAVQAGSCGCGSRLRGMRFLPGVGHTNPYKTTK